MIFSFQFQQPQLKHIEFGDFSFEPQPLHGHGPLVGFFLYPLDDGIVDFFAIPYSMPDARVGPTIYLREPELLFFM